MADLKIYDLIDLTALRKLFEEHGEKRTVRKGEHFCRMEHTAKEIGLVVSGVFGFMRPDSKGRNQIISFAAHGDIVGAIISLRPTRMSAFDVVALCPAEILVVKADEIFGIMESIQPGFRLMLTDAIAYGFMMRMISFRCDKPEDRYTELLERMPKIASMIPMSAIASYLGMTREAFARLRSRLKV
ncbi:MAG: Crp/Fnr family transcriptional regulator [Muribaculaceae bacterium]|nr:Crp/Fnr family transcriptional regulator [Muribaculaceae bacterium]